MNRYGVRSYLRPIRRQLVRIAGMADHRERHVAFRRLSIETGHVTTRYPHVMPRSLRAGHASPRTWAEPIYRSAP